ncbi:unnamed protein product [Lactuca saligna]|uniref:Uncharacterized protein n=1 Tax=Lactuca saligna TaxID=75948 RepID=A0AA35YXG2_LACSI|nr:unnamed protein product [Lactuca saligna]
MVDTFLCCGDFSSREENVILDETTWSTLSHVMGWARLFRIQEPVYREFLLEFYATVSYDPGKPLNDRTAFAFRLGGVSRECSVIELATRVGIYTADETRSVHFPTFLADCLTERPEELQ